MNKSTTNVLIVGVGGQGVLLASEILTEVAKRNGMDAKKSEVHGMSQRGGIVTSHVRFGEKVNSPLIPSKESDVILAFEIAEGLRWVGEKSSGGKIVVNTQKIIPTITTTGKFSYPKDIEAKIREVASDAIFIDGYGIALELGNPRLVNTILLGVLSQFLEIERDIWLEVIEKMAPKGTAEINRKAFLRGAEYE